MLTHSQSQQINSAVYTHEYDLTNSQDFTSQFETDTSMTNGEDIGGIIVYMQDRKLVAFFDYENAAGAVF